MKTIRKTENRVKRWAHIPGPSSHTAIKDNRVNRWAQIPGPYSHTAMQGKRVKRGA